ncbi:MAG: ATP-binding protein [Pyrinomonadaceae bacterium]
MRSLQILHLENEQVDADLIRETLVSQGFSADILRVETEEEFRTALQDRSMDLILSGYTIPTLDGLSALKFAQEQRPELPFIFVSGTIGEEGVAEGLKGGATDYILKEGLQRLGPSIKRALGQVAEHQERLEADKQLRESEERNRVFFEGSPLPMWVYDQETLRFLSVNEAALTQYGYLRPEFLDLTLGDIYFADDLDLLLAHVAALGPQNGKAGIWRHRRKDGLIFEAEVTSQRIDNLGRHAQVVLACDVSIRRLAEAAQSVSEIRYRRLFESAFDGMLILDGDSERIIDVNPYLIELLKYPKEQFLGKELWEIGLFKDISASKAAVVELRARGYVRYDDLPLESSEGVVTNVEIVANSYLEGEKRVIHCNVRDISERSRAGALLNENKERLEQAVKELEDKRKELTAMTQQLWQASKLTTMGELAASVAHELNNPLATVALRVESAMEDLGEDDPQRQPLEIISQEVERMAKLVRTLLQFSRRSYRQISTVDIPKELSNSLDLIEFYLRSRQVEVVRDFAGNVPHIYADRQLLHQVFLNLITNASDAMPDGGTLTIRTFRGILETDRPAVVVEFIDTGTGVQTGDLPKLWEPFFTTKPEGKGTGLGLAICRRTVEEHRGTIAIKSLPGRGTTVRITLPTTEEGVAAAA